jgi:hypothetical protein
MILHCTLLDQNANGSNLKIMFEKGIILPIGVSRFSSPSVIPDALSLSVASVSSIPSTSKMGTLLQQHSAGCRLESLETGDGLARLGLYCRLAYFLLLLEQHAHLLPPPAPSGKKSHKNHAWCSSWVNITTKTIYNAHTTYRTQQENCFFLSCLAV